VDAGGDYVDYYAAHGYAHGIGEVVDRVTALLDQGHAEAVIELAEHAVKRVEEAIGWTDDSNGELGDLLEQLGELHHDACLQARPDPRKLAKRLFELELGTEYDTFRGTAGSRQPSGRGCHRSALTTRRACAIRAGGSASPT
jgi:hypothetical protein